MLPLTAMFIHWLAYVWFTMITVMFDSTDDWPVQTSLYAILGLVFCWLWNRLVTYTPMGPLASSISINILTGAAPTRHYYCQLLLILYTARINEGISPHWGCQSPPLLVIWRPRAGQFLSLALQMHTYRWQVAQYSSVKSAPKRILLHKIPPKFSGEGAHLLPRPYPHIC